MSKIHDLHMRSVELYHEISVILFDIGNVLLKMNQELNVGDKPVKKTETKSKAIVKKKMEKVGKEFKEGKLHSGSKKGPVVTNPKQMQAIAFSDARKQGAKIPKKKVI